MEVNPDGSAMEELRRVMSEPIFNPVLKTFFGEGKLDYELYVKTSELFSLQPTAEELVSPTS
ncbi:hypothetical protein [Streptosporangium sp. V21-05]|uniref:hypothetical protein n=1 Tax=Streptosporangium sp. V21-05 TaxID=3446115 RepID=UPI003F5351FB